MKNSPRRPASFLAIPPRLQKRERCLFHVVSAPLEATVSYGHGTSRGPRAILEASTKVEPFDGVSIPAQAGIVTLPPLRFHGNSPAQAGRKIEAAVRRVAEAGKFPVMLGGEHSVTAGAVKAMQEVMGPIGVVQFDAHTDLRDAYGSPPSRLSHACVMRRVLDLGVPLFQIGIRSFDQHDPEVRRRYHVGSLDAAVIARRGIPRRLLPPSFPSRIYITFDVDAFDPSLMPATGTPEPGGLSWDQAIEAVENVLRGRRLVGCDVVELAPIPGFHAADFTAAKLVYTFMGLAARQKRPRTHRAH